MTPQEKISFLVNILEGGNARAFAEKAGIPEASLSRARNGKGNAETYFPRIIIAYKDVNPKWLLDGEGLPLKSMEEKGAVLERLERLEKEVRALRKALKVG